MKEKRELLFSRPENCKPREIKYLPQFMRLVRAFLHKTVWLVAHGFPTILYVCERRYLGGKYICQEAEFPIVHSFLKSLKEGKP